MCVKMTERRFYLNSVPSEVIKSVLFQSGFEDITDIDNYVLVATKHLLEPFNANKIPCWVQLCSHSNNSNGLNENVRLALALGLPSITGSTLVGSDIFCHNIKKSLCRKDLTCVERPRFTFHIVKDSPAFAECIEVGIIKEPFGKVKDSLAFQSHMNTFFKIPRYVQAGDVLCVPGLKDEAIKYVALRVLGKSIAPGFIVEAERTKIEQGPEIKCYLPTHPLTLKPMRTSQPMTAANFKEFLIDKCPPWLHRHAVCLACLLLPFLPSSNNEVVLGPAKRHLPLILVTGPKGSGKRAVIEAAAQGTGVWDMGGLHLCSHDCSTLRGSGPGSIEKTLSSLLASLTSTSPCLVVIHNVEWLALGRDGPDEGRGIESWMKWLGDLKKQCKGVVAVVATSHLERMNLPAPLARMFVEEINLHGPPDLTGREDMLKWLIQAVGATPQSKLIKELAELTAGFIFGDLIALISGALRKKYMDVRNSCCEVRDILLNDEDFEDTINRMHAAYSDAIGAPKIPSVSWEDVGGLSDIREEILTTIEMPIKHPELMLAGLKRTGILLYGPPGTGKTLLAKAVATECSFNFISVKGPELLNMYVGQSEANVREVFQRARNATPCIIFFDELDSLAPNRGRTGDSGGVMDRVVSQLLAEMDGQQKSNNVFIMGATNRPDLVDPALLRPGRFDKILYIGPYEDRKSQLSVMSALTRKFNLSSDVVLKDVVSAFPERMSGADMQAVCSGAIVHAIQRAVSGSDLVQDGDMAQDRTELLINSGDFHQSLADIKPSISTEDLLHFKKLRLQFEKSLSS